MGTGRILGVVGVTCDEHPCGPSAMPDAVWMQIDEDHNLFEDLTVCPITKNVKAGCKWSASTLPETLSSGRADLAPPAVASARPWGRDLDAVQWPTRWTRSVPERRGVWRRRESNADPTPRRVSWNRMESCRLADLDSRRAGLIGKVSEKRCTNLYQEAVPRPVEEPT